MEMTVCEQTVDCREQEGLKTILETGKVVTES